ncbi:MAG: hypothetical protein WA177_15145 [Xanthobacteraceae bacterium]
MRNKSLSFQAQADPMYAYHEDQAHAVECLLKATLASNAVEHQNWLALADAWLTLCDLEKRAEHELQVAMREADALVRETRAVTPRARKTAQILKWQGR